ncbi:hypothetical protein Tsubulata_047406 [Turnera subulata]|uniref:Cryptochrome DASH n=1 Tax=Turnera subulata TaxID=218843 RepID=A0A9Q0J9Y3_9ROSI|nr:hypothetical protein Tsubulata_047406 [Turnera subulata]
MAMLSHYSISSPSLKKFIYPSKPTSKITHYRCYTKLVMNFQMMNSISLSTSSSSSSSTGVLQQVPGLNSTEMDRVLEPIFERYSSKAIKRNGKGTAIVWFRNDLRVLDNEALYKAWVSSEVVLPVYCVDPRHFQTTYYFGFPKTGALRAEFLSECLTDLKKNLMKRGLNLLIRQGKPEEILPFLAKEFSAHTVYAQKETCSEELTVERLLSKALKRVQLTLAPQRSSSQGSTSSPSLQLSVEAKCSVRGVVKIPTSLAPPPNIEDWGCFPPIEQLGLRSQKISKGMQFVGGETAAIGRVHEYFWKKASVNLTFIFRTSLRLRASMISTVKEKPNKLILFKSAVVLTRALCKQNLLRVYKETRNGMLGPDYSTKFSPWLASGSLSPRIIFAEVKRYEEQREANNSTYWVVFELIWRDYFRFLSMKYGNSIFHLGGPRKVEQRWGEDQRLFESWRDGCTGYPLIDANMKELSATGFMSNRGRQIVCSFLVRDMGIDWRMGAEWFETCLLDYDPCSNYGNWTYGAGVGNDPREDRYFSIPKQASTF